MDNQEIIYAEEVSKGMKDGQEKIRGLVMKKYDDIAKGNAGGCSPSCCGQSHPLITIQEIGM